MDPTALEGGNPVHDYLTGLFAEHTPTIPEVPGVDLEEYKKQLVKRFSNPFIKDSLQRLAEDGSMKLVTTMRDAALENAKAGRQVPFFSFLVASWIRYLVGVDEKADEIEIKDPKKPQLMPLARKIFNYDPDAHSGPTVTIAKTWEVCTSSVPSFYRCRHRQKMRQ